MAEMSWISGFNQTVQILLFSFEGPETQGSRYIFDVRKDSKEVPKTKRKMVRLAFAIHGRRCTSNVLLVAQEKNKDCKVKTEMLD